MEDKPKINKNSKLNYDLVEAFNIFDKDKDGFITVKELESATLALGYNLTNEEIRNLVSNYDKDASGNVDISEFRALMIHIVEEQEEVNEILEIFELYDRNGDGLLSKEELSMVLKQGGFPMSENEINIFFQAADLDEDGQINFYEFSKIMKKKN